MKVQYSFETVDVGDEFIAVPVGENASEIHGIVKMNTEGKEIFDLLTKGLNEEEIVNVLLDKYDNDKDKIVEYVHNVIIDLKEHGLLTD